MLVLIELASLLAVYAGAYARTPPYLLYDIEQAEYHFQDFLRTYNKHYEGHEYNERLEIFKENLVEINKKNEDPEETAIFGITKFSDLSKEEFSSFYLGGGGPSLTNLQQHLNNTRIYEFDKDSVRFIPPEEYDARDKGLVTEVRDQGKCASGWAFAVGTIKTTYLWNHTKLTEFSKQQFIDCSLACVEGCSVNCTTYDAVQSDYFLETEEDYPYEGKKGECRSDPKKTKAELAGFVIFTNKPEEEDWYRWSARPDWYPFTFALRIDATDLQHYKSGVLKKCGFKNFNHAILLIGWGKDKKDGEKYWILKNSWGKDFGEEGYFRVKRNINACGLVSDYGCVGEFIPPKHLK